MELVLLKEHNHVPEIRIEAINYIKNRIIYDAHNFRNLPTREIIDNSLVAQPREVILGVGSRHAVSKRVQRARSSLSPNIPNGIDNLILLN